MEGGYGMQGILWCLRSASLVVKAETMGLLQAGAMGRTSASDCCALGRGSQAADRAALSAGSDGRLSLCH